MLASFGIAILYPMALGGLSALGYLTLLDPLTQVIVGMQSALYVAGVARGLWGSRAIHAEGQQLAAVRPRLEVLRQTLRNRNTPVMAAEVHRLAREVLHVEDLHGLPQEALQWALATAGTAGRAQPPFPSASAWGDLRPLPSLMMTLGLLGTFLGMVRAMTTLQGDLTDVASTLAMLLGGIYQALGTSIVGLAGFALLSGLGFQIARQQKQGQVELERFVQAELLPVLWSNSLEEASLRSLCQLPETLGHTLSVTLQDAVAQALEGSGSLLATAASQLEQTTERLGMLAGEGMDTLTSLTAAAREELQTVHGQHERLVERFGQTSQALTQTTGEVAAAVQALRAQQEQLTQGMQDVVAGVRDVRQTGETLCGVLTQQEHVLQDATATTRETARQLAVARDTVANGAEHVQQLLDGHLHTLRQVATEHMQGVEATHTRIDATLERLDRHAEAQAQALTTLAQWGNAQRVAEVLGTLEQLAHTLTLLHRQQMARRNGFSGLLHRILGGNHDRRA